MKKRVLFIVYRMDVGGVERALLGELTHYNPDEWDIEVAMLVKTGELLELIPKHVKVWEIKEFAAAKDKCWCTPRLEAVKAFKKMRLATAFRMLYFMLRIKLTGTYKVLYDWAFADIPKHEGHYDRAIAYAGPYLFIDRYLTECIEADEKWGWIHFDVNSIFMDVKQFDALYDSYSHINIVSEDGKKNFDKMFPRHAGKTEVCYNVIDQDTVLALAEEDPVPNPADCDGRINIVTVGRVSEEKGQCMTLEVLRQLVEEGFSNLTWWYVGDGKDLEHCKRLAEDLCVSGHVRFVGVRRNPYPYMRMADIYVQPSVHEGFCITLGEAKLFGMPIIATNFIGAKEQLDGYGAYHDVIGHDAASMAEAIKRCVRLL